METPLWAIFVVILATIVGAFGAIFFKKASADISLNIKFLANKNFIIGIAFYAVSTVIFLIALKAGELSILYPTVAMIYIWIGILSQKLLGERMNTLKWLGVFLIIIGVTFLGLGA